MVGVLDKQLLVRLLTLMIQNYQDGPAVLSSVLHRNLSKKHSKARMQLSVKSQTGLMVKLPNPSRPK